MSEVEKPSDELLDSHARKIISNIDGLMQKEEHRLMGIEPVKSRRQEVLDNLPSMEPRSCTVSLSILIKEEYFSTGQLLDKLLSFDTKLLESCRKSFTAVVESSENQANIATAGAGLDLVDTAICFRNLRKK